MSGAAGLVSRNTPSTGTTSYAFDPRGNVAHRTNSSGAVTSTDLYDGYGKPRAGASDVWGFGGQAGYYTDAETGLVLCTNRFYDPQSGRFLTRDPIGYAGGINLYGYVGNNPVNRMDPEGLDWLDNAANFSAGWGDMLTFNATKWGRLGAGELVGAGDANEGIDYNSGWYHGGEAVGLVNGIAIVPAGTLNAGARSIFYAGGSGAAQAEAEAIAAAEGKTLLSSTLGGKALNWIAGVLPRQIGRSDAFWRVPSAIYALNAKGIATAVIRSPVRSRAIWNTTERPILQFCKTAISYR